MPDMYIDFLKTLEDDTIIDDKGSTLLTIRAQTIKMDKIRKQTEAEMITTCVIKDIPKFDTCKLLKFMSYIAAAEIPVASFLPACIKSIQEWDISGDNNLLSKQTFIENCIIQGQKYPQYHQTLNDIFSTDPCIQELGNTYDNKQFLQWLTMYIYLGHSVRDSKHKISEYIKINKDNLDLFLCNIPYRTKVLSRKEMTILFSCFDTDIFRLLKKGDKELLQYYALEYNIPFQHA